MADFGLFCLVLTSSVFVLTWVFTSAYHSSRLPFYLCFNICYLFTV